MFQKNKPKMVVCAFIFLLFVSVPTQTSLAQVTEEQIIYVMPYDFNEYSAFTANSYATAQWNQLVYAGLLKRSSGPNFPWVADLADGMPIISEDNLKFTFKLKNNLKFSNGEDLTAEDVELSLKALVTPNINRAGYESYSGFFNNNSFTQISMNEFSITFTQSYAFAYNLLNFPIVPLETFGAKYENCLDGVAADCSWNSEDGSDAISAGPFKVTDIDNTNEIVTLIANPYYHNAKQVRTDKVIFQKIAERNAAVSALNQGVIDIVDSQYYIEIDTFEGQNDIHVEVSPEPATQEMAINHYHPYFGTGELIPNSIGETNESQIFENARLLRKAMSLLMDRYAVVKDSMRYMAKPAATTMPAASIGFDPSVDYDPFDIDQARQIMTSLGFNFATLGEVNENNQYQNYFFDVTVLTPDSCGGGGTNWAATYVKDLPKIGIGVSQHVSTGWSELIERTFGSETNPPLYQDGGFDIFFVGYSWNLDWNPTGMFDSSGSCTSGNCGNFYNFDLNESMTPIGSLVRQYIDEWDFDERIDTVHQIQRELAYWYPTIPILYPISHFAWNNEIVGLNAPALNFAIQEWDKVYKPDFELNEAFGEQENSEKTNSLNNSGIIVIIPLITIPLLVSSIRKREKQI